MMFRFLFLACVLLLVLLLLLSALPSHAQLAPAPPQPVCTQALHDRLDQFMTDTLRTSKAPGMILGIWVPGRGEYLRAQGVADRATNTPMQVTDTFRIGSMTKTFTSTVILQLVDEGKLKLDDAINKYTRATVNTSLIPVIPGGNQITIRMLLNHTSGLYNYSEIDTIDKQIDQRFVTFTPQQLVNAGIAKPPYFAPGKGYTYSNTNTVILGMLVEQLTQQSLEQEITRRFITPLRLVSTAFPTTSVFIPGHYSHGYAQEKPDSPLVEWTDQDTSWAWAAGGMTSNINDLHTWIIALTSPGLLSPALQQERMTSYTPYSKNEQLTTLRYGLNVFTLGGFVGHNGGLPGFVCMAMRQPQTGDTIIFMLNAQTPTGDTVKILSELLPILYPGIKL